MNLLKYFWMKMKLIILYFIYKVIYVLILFLKWFFFGLKVDFKVVFKVYVL